MSEAKRPENNNYAPQDVSAYDTASSDGEGASPIEDIVMRPETITEILEEDVNSTTYADNLKVILLIEDHQFIVHGSKIREFTRISSMLENIPEEGGTKVARLHESVYEFSMMLEVLCTPIYRSATFSIDTLVSALAMATKYDHPALREYAIRMLEPRQHELSAIRRIKVSQACNIPEWAPGAIGELCKRRELISLEEANKLGADVFMAISRQRALENTGSEAPKSVVSTVARTISTGICYFVLFIGLLVFAGELGMVASYLSSLVIGILGRVAVRMGRTIVGAIVKVWMFFDPGV